MAGPLDGIRVIDFSAIVSGPLAGMILADQGADVIKIEGPGAGDAVRLMNPARGGLSAFLANCNRGKRSLEIDLKNERGQKIVQELVKTADVLIQNFRPGAIERLGLGYDEMSKLNPDLIYMSISGFGDSGPYADRRVYDPIIQGLTGNVAIQKNPLTDMTDLVRNIICDKASAYTAAQAISAALFARERGAGGQHIKVPMIDAALAFFWPDGMLKHTLLEDDATPGFALYEIYRLTDTEDGHLIYFMGSEAEFRGMFRALDRQDLLDDGRFSGPGISAENLMILGEILENEFRKWKTEAITRRLVDEQVPVGPVLSLDEVLEDAQIRHNASIIEREHPSAGRLREARPGAHFGGTVPDLAPIAPLKGEHTDEILTELGIDNAELERLRADGILGP